MAGALVDGWSYLTRGNRRNRRDGDLLSEQTARGLSGVCN